MTNRSKTYGPRQKEPRIGLGALMLAASACASTQSAGPEMPNPISPKAARPMALFDGRTGEPVTQAQLDSRLAKAKIVYVGEQHDNAEHHRVQLEVMKRLLSKGSVGVGLEMVQRPFQTGLDRFLATGNETQLLADVQWEARWGYDFALYRPIFQLAKTHQSPLLALNADRALSRAIATKGLASLSSEETSRLPELDLSQVRHRERVRLIWLTHGKIHGMPFERFYQAQVLWDETMAATLSQAAQNGSGPERWLVLAGAGHIRFHEGIPSRAERRGLTDQISILPLDHTEASTVLGAGAADILWVFLPSEPAA